MQLEVQYFALGLDRAWGDGDLGGADPDSKRPALADAQVSVQRVGKRRPSEALVHERQRRPLPSVGPNQGHRHERAVVIKRERHRPGGGRGCPGRHPHVGRGRRGHAAGQRRREDQDERQGSRQRACDEGHVGLGGWVELS